MGTSSRFSIRIEALAALEHGPAHRGAAPGGIDEGLRAVFPFASLAVVAGPGEGVAGRDGTTGAPVEDALDRLVSPASPRQSHRGRRVIGGRAEAATPAAGLPRPSRTAGMTAMSPSPARPRPPTRGNATKRGAVA